MRRFSAIIALVTVLLCGMSILPISRAQGVVYRLYLPIVQKPAFQASGKWQGIATQTGTIFDYGLTLSTSGTQVEGTARVSNGTQYAVMSLTGSVIGSQLLLDAHAIIESNGPPPGGRWCIPTLLLAPDTGSEVLVGTWKQDGCNSGRVYLQRPTASAMTVAGTWNGTATQGTSTFTYEITVNQSGTILEGLATTRRNTTFGTMRIKGGVVGNHVIWQETELLQSGGSSSWCFKTVEMQLTTTSGSLTLEGPWSALGCISGQVKLSHQ
jgi:hypothetical protein